MENRVEIPKHIKYYDFIKSVIEQYVENYDDFIENVRVKETHSIFLDKYGLNNYINWIF